MELKHEPFLPKDNFYEARTARQSVLSKLVLERAGISFVMHSYVINGLLVERFYVEKTNNDWFEMEKLILELEVIAAKDKNLKKSFDSNLEQKEKEYKR